MKRDTKILNNILPIESKIILKGKYTNPPVVYQVKDLPLTLQRPRSLLWQGFDPGPGTSTCHGLGQKKKGKISNDQVGLPKNVILVYYSKGSAGYHIKRLKNLKNDHLNIHRKSI